MKKTKNQLAWEIMRKNKDFFGSDIMASKKDATMGGYLNALERAGYISQTSMAKSPYDRRYKLILNTGEMSPIYQTSRKRGDNLYPAMVKDRNITRDIFLDGKKVEMKSKKEMEFLGFIKKEESFTYQKALQLFKNEEHEKGYDYNLLHYYLEKFKKNEILKEVEKHRYIFQN